MRKSTNTNGHAVGKGANGSTRSASGEVSGKKNGGGAPRGEKKKGVNVDDLFSEDVVSIIGGASDDDVVLEADDDSEFVAEEVEEEVDQYGDASTDDRIDEILRAAPVPPG